MPALTIGSLFSGYGGLDMGVAAVLPDATVAWHAEIEPAACRLLTHRFPDVPNYGDVARINWSTVPHTDVLTGGFPCQDLSIVGRRLGLRPGTRSGLWEHMAYAINQLQPQLVVVENVRGLLSARAHRGLGPDSEDLEDPGTLRALGAVLGDLADLGYDAAWQGLRAADVGAPHGRFRIFICAWPAAGDPDCAGLERADLSGRPLLPRWSAPGPRPAAGPGHDAAALGCADAGRWGPFAAAVARWELILGRPAPDPVERRIRSGRGLSPAFVEWVMGLPAGWVTAVPAVSDQLDLFGADVLAPEERLSATVNEQLKMLGNGVVPQQAAAGIAHLLATAVPAPVLARLELAANLAA